MHVLKFQHELKRLNKYRLAVIIILIVRWWHRLKGKIMNRRRGWMRCLFWMFKFNDINRDQHCLVGCFVLKTVIKKSNFPYDVQHDFFSAYIKSMLEKRNILSRSYYLKIMHNSMGFSQLSALLTKEEIHFQRDYTGNW